LGCCEYQRIVAMENHFYLGIDLDDWNAVVSYYELNMREPETFSATAGSEVFQIPVAIAKKRGIDQWLVGEEARRLAETQGERAHGQLLGRALRAEMVFVDGETYPARRLLALYLKKLILLAGSLRVPKKPDTLVICLEKLSRDTAELFSEIAPELGVAGAQLMFLDRRESFYYFVCHQKQELRLHDVCLFDYRRGDMSCLTLSQNPRTTPHLVTITEDIRKLGHTERDAEFNRILEESFRGRIVSCAYLVGDGFDGGWMKCSVAFLCKGRRAFIGKNLYAKGACYAAAVRDSALEWPYIYLGDSEMKVNVSLKLRSKEALEFFTLISAGDNWYEAVGECEVILDGSKEIAFWLQLPNSKEAKVETLELSDLPDRPPRATRLRITAKPLSDTRVCVCIKDMGFGEFYQSSGKIWEYVMSA